MRLKVEAEKIAKGSSAEEIGQWNDTVENAMEIKGLKETTHGYKKERNKANDFTCKLQYDVCIFSNRRQSDFTKCALMISQREIMISRLVWLESSYAGSTQSSRQSVF